MLVHYHTFSVFAKIFPVFGGGNFQLILEITSLIIKPNPALALLNLGIDNIPCPFHVVISHILLAARATITKSWKQSQAPNPADSIEILKTHFVDEHLLAVSNTKASRFLKQWRPWIC